MARSRGVDAAGPLAVLGQTALFFYLLHVHVLYVAGDALHLGHATGLAGAYAGGLAVVVVLYPFCVRFRRYKRAHPDGWAQIDENATRRDFRAHGTLFRSLPRYI